MENINYKKEIIKGILIGFSFLIEMLMTFENWQFIFAMVTIVIIISITSNIFVEYLAEGIKRRQTCKKKK